MIKPRINQPLHAKADVHFSLWMMPSQSQVAPVEGIIGKRRIIKESFKKWGLGLYYRL
jgi:hypothetical protein